MALEFDYYYGSEAEQYSFYRVPKTLFTDMRFKKVSSEAKLLYGLMLDRMGLSIKNSWIDHENKVYIIFTISDIMELLGCAEQKAVKLLQELDSKKGIGLIESKRQGLGKPNLLYVKNFISVPPEVSSAPAPELPQKEELEPNQAAEQESQFKNCENHNSAETSHLSQFQSCENRNSGTMKITIQEQWKSQCNKTDINNTENNNSSIYPPTPLPKEPDKLMDEIESYTKIVEDNIEYDVLKHNLQHVYHEPPAALDGIVELIAETVCSKKPYIRIGQEELPAEAVRLRLLKLGYSHIDYVLSCLRQNTTKINNIRAYLLTALYRASTTLGVQELYR